MFLQVVVMGEYSSETAASGDVRLVTADDVKWRCFVGALMIVSLAPMAMFPLLGAAPASGTGPFYAMFALFALSSNFHVGATGWFFTDREMRSHFAANPARYIVAPLLTIAATTTVFAIGNERATNLVVAGG